MNVCIYCEQQSTCQKKCDKKIYYDVKELAEEIYRAGVALDGSDFAHKSDHFERLAGELYNAGYRKQSDTIREFAEKLNAALAEYEPRIKGSYGVAETVGLNVAKRKLEKLATEYGVEVE
jgi:hypothetical protein